MLFSFRFSLPSTIRSGYTSLYPVPTHPRYILLSKIAQRRLFMDSDLPGSEAVPDEREAIPSTEPDASGGPVQPEQGLEDDEIQIQIDLLKDFLERLEITRPEVVRVTQARYALWWFGRALREGHSGPDRYHQSEVRQHIAQFWSHSWHGNKMSKILLLLVVYNGFPASLVGSAVFVSVRICIDPELELFPMKHTAAWSTLAGIVLSGLTILMWPSRRRVFLDRICIHQKDERLKAEGMLNLAALLKHSRSMLVCWDPSYMLRMWCTVELAAYLKCHSDGPLIIRPVSWGPCTVVGFLCVAMLWVVPEVLLQQLETRAADDVLSVLFAASVMVFMYFTSAVVRSHFRAACAVQEQLKTFSFYNDTHCHCCRVNHVNPKTGQRMSCDRQTIAGCLDHWFGSVAAFDALVQQDVSQSFERGVIMRCVLPYAWLTRATVPIAWYGLHLGLDFHYRTRDSWLAFCNALYILAWWLGTVPVILAFWMRIPRRCQQQCSARWREVMLNAACSCAMGIMFVAVRLAENAILYSIPTFGIVTVSAMSLLAAIICLGDWGRCIHLFRRTSSA